MANPNDLVFNGTLADCVYGSGDEGIPGSVALADDREERVAAGRAAAQRRFADEADVDFGKVRSCTMYGRIFTRQEAWDDYGRERAADDAFFDLGFRHANDWTPDKPVGAPANRWVEHEEAPGVRVPDSAIDAALALDAPGRVPDDWEPDEDEDVWEACGPTALGATKLWVFEC